MRTDTCRRARDSRGCFGLRPGATADGAVLAGEEAQTTLSYRRTGDVKIPNDFNATVGPQMLSPNQEDFEKYGFFRLNNDVKSIA